MKKKSCIVKLGISLLVLCLLLGTYFLLKQKNEEKTSQEDTSEEVFETSSDEIESISFLLDQQNVTFQKEEEQWINKDDKNFPVDQEKVEDLLTSLESITSVRTIEDADNLEEYGLEEPSQTIQITENEKTRTIQLGSYNETADAYYGKIDDGEEIYLLNADFETSFEGTLYDFAEGSTFPVISASDIDQIQVNGENTYTLAASDEVSSGWMISDGEASEEADSSEASAAASSVNSLSYLSFVNYHCEDDSAYGLDQPRASIVIDYHQTVEEEDSGDSDESSEEESGSEEAEQKQVTLLVGNEADDGYYVCESGSQEIYTMSAESIDNLIGKTVSDYWNLKVNYYAITEIQSISVTYAGETNKMEVQSLVNEEDETEYEYYFDGEEADENAFKNFYNALVNISAQERMEENYQPTGDAEWKFTFEQNGEKETVSYYTYNENFNVAVKDDGTSYLVNKMNVKNLVDLLTALREKEDSEKD